MAQVRPNSAKPLLGVDRDWPDVGRNSIRIGVTSDTDLGQTWPDVGQIRPRLARNRATWPDFGQICLDLGQICFRLLRRGQATQLLRACVLKGQHGGFSQFRMADGVVKSIGVAMVRTFWPWVFDLAFRYQQPALDVVFRRRLWLDARDGPGARPPCSRPRGRPLTPSCART